MAAARSRRGDEGTPKARTRSDAYVGLLGLSLLALSSAMVFAFLDYNSYPEGKPKPAQIAPRGGPAAGPQGGPVVAPPAGGVNPPPAGGMQGGPPPAGAQGNPPAPPAGAQGNPPPAGMQGRPPAPPAPPGKQ
jgi:hypothetical protein